MAVLQKYLRYDGKLSAGSNMWGGLQFQVKPYTRLIVIITSELTPS